MKNLLKIFKLLPKNLILSSKLLVLFTILLVILEIISLSSIIPLLTSITYTDISQLNNKFIFLGSNFSSKSSLVYFFISIFFIVYLIKILFNIFYIFFSNKFSFKIYYFLSSNLCETYLNQNWTFYLKNNTAYIMRNIIGEANTVRVSYIEPVLKILSEIFVLFGVVILLLIVEYKITFSIIIIVLFTTFIYKTITKSLFINLGKIRLDSSGLINKTLIQTFSLIKEIKILNKIDYFLREYKNVLNKYLESTRKASIQVTITKQVFEIISLLILVFLLFFFVDDLNNFQEHVPIIGLFLGAAYRIIPSANKILNAYQRLNLGEKSLETVLGILDKKTNFKNNYIYSNDKLIFKDKIEFKNIYFSYDIKNPVIENLSFEIKKNSIFGIFGKSGKGKTTLINLISGLLKPSKGKIIIDGKDVDLAQLTWQKNIGFVQQEIYLMDDSIEKNIAFGVPEKDINKDKIKRTLALVELENFVNSLDLKEKTHVGDKAIRVSGGQKQRVGIARMLYADRNILIFDEATRSLDKQTEKEILKSIKKLSDSCTIIMISHDYDILNLCDQVLNLDNKKVS